MDRTNITTALAMQELNCKKIDNIRDRILLQKKIYIAQIFGLRLGYGYSWYLHGPYSPDLASAAYQIVPEGFDDLIGWSFKPKYNEVIKRVNSLENENKTSLDIVEWYELLSSVIYWRENGNIEKDKNIEKVMQTKPQFSREEIELAYKTLIGVEYIK